MSGLLCIRDLVNLWPTRAELAADLKRQFPDISVSVHQVHKWAEKQSVPARYHYPLLCAARARGFQVTADMIAKMHAQPVTKRGAA